MTEIEYTEDGDLFIPLQGTLLGPETQKELREVFRREEDERLNRWRWPENPTCVVKEGEPTGDFGRGRTVYVFHEETFDRFHFNERVMNVDAGSTVAHQAARAYFDAHPKPEPKPWHAAKSGEAWVLTVDGEEYPWGVGDGVDAGRFVYLGGLSNIPIDHPSITSGRRIYPENAS